MLRRRAEFPGKLRETCGWSEEMIVIVVTGAPAVGKTTLLPVLADMLGEKGAFLDGDAVGRTRPLTRTIERLNLIQDNICSCADNFAAWGARYLVTCFVFPSHERLGRITARLRAAGHTTIVVALVASDEEMIARIRQKADDHGQDPESIESTLAINRGLRGLKDIANVVDTTGLPVADVAGVVVELVRGTEHDASQDGAPAPFRL